MQDGDLDDRASGRRARSEYDDHEDRPKLRVACEKSSREEYEHGKNGDNQEPAERYKVGFFVCEYGPYIYSRDDHAYKQHR